MCLLVLFGQSLERLTPEPAQSQLFVVEQAEAVAPRQIRQNFELAPNAEVETLVDQAGETFDVKLAHELLHDVDRLAAGAVGLSGRSQLQPMILSKPSRTLPRSTRASARPRPRRCSPSSLQDGDVRTGRLAGTSGFG